MLLFASVTNFASVCISTKLDLDSESAEGRLQATEVHDICGGLHGNYGCENGGVASQFGQSDRVISTTRSVNRRHNTRLCTRASVDG